MLRRTAEVVAADYELLRQQLEDAWARAVISEHSSEDGGGLYVIYDLAVLRGLPLGLQRSLLREGIHRLRRTLRNINWVHIDNAIAVLQNGHTGAAATLPQGLVLRLGYEQAIVADAQQVILDPTRPHLWVESLAVPSVGQVALPKRGDCGPPTGDWMLETEIYPREAAPLAYGENRDAYTAYLDADRARQPLALRTRREGDSFYPLGLGHRQTLRDFMINCKIPSQERSTVPLLVCGDEIAWVVGWRIDARYAVTERTERVLVVRVRRAAQAAPRAG